MKSFVAFVMVDSNWYQLSSSERFSTSCRKVLANICMWFLRPSMPALSNLKILTSDNLFSH